MIPGAFASEITKIPPMDEVLRRHTRVSQEFPKHFQPLAGRPIRKLGCSLPDAALDHGFTACRIKKPLESSAAPILIASRGLWVP